MASTICLVFAFVLAVLAAANINHPKVSLGWASLAFFELSFLIGALVGGRLL